MKSKLRKYYISLREKKYFEVANEFADRFLKKITITKKNIIGSYWPINSELNVQKLNTVLNEKGFRVSLPSIQNNKKMVFKILQNHASLKLHSFGIPEPDSNSSLVIPDIFLVPLVAFDKFGNRLGYGAGFYDRYFSTLSKHKKVFKIGVGFSFQMCKKIPNTKRDLKLDAICTETKLYNIS